jgi:hypothetical protein
MILGWEEVLDVDEWLFLPNMVPSTPFTQVGVYGTASKVSRYDSDTSTLATGYSASATSFSVASTGGILWVTGSSAPTFPLDIDVEGVRIRVDSISGASSPQTFTVRRSVDGTDKALSSGAKVRLWQPDRYAL